ncbi:MAG TPA: hypothetical protein VKW06_10540 [Candidatus Angelobacter sp.]|nr:hypothetical protein [Candidatus Angelobacter sp.]
MKKMYAFSLLAFLLFSAPAFPKTRTTATTAPTTPKAVSAYVDTASTGLNVAAIVAVFPQFSIDLHFTDLSVMALVPSQGCATIVEIIDGQNGQPSQQLFLGQGGEGSSQHFAVDFVVPAGDVAFIAVYEQGTCVSPARKLNVSAFYQ